MLLSKDKHYEQEVVEAKQKELDMMERYDVFEEVKKANHQCISSRWVVTEKFKNGKQVVKQNWLQGVSRRALQILSSTHQHVRENLYVCCLL